MILYCIEREGSTIIVKEDGEKEIKKKFIEYVDDLCLSSLSTLKGRKEALKKVFGYKYNVPLFVNNQTILFKIRKENNLYLNACSVKFVEKENDRVTIIFKNGKVLVLNNNYCEIRKIMINKEKILSFLKTL